MTSDSKNREQTGEFFISVFFSLRIFLICFVLLFVQLLTCRSLTGDEITQDSAHIVHCTEEYEHSRTDKHEDKLRTKGNYSCFHYLRDSPSPAGFLHHLFYLYSLLGRSCDPTSIASLTHLQLNKGVHTDIC